MVFLHGNGTLSVEIYMNAPNGLHIEGNKCLCLRRTIHGLVQSAREFYKKLLCEHKDLGFLENKADCCLLSKRNQTGIMIIGIYVNDCLVLGKERAINQLIAALKSKCFSLKAKRDLKDYLSC